MKIDASLLLLGNLAVEKDFISQDQLDIALKDQIDDASQLGEILVKREWITDLDLIVLVKIHEQKVLFHDEIQFGHLLVVNKFATSSEVDLALQEQKSDPSKLVGDILIGKSIINHKQCVSILKSQKRLFLKREAQKQTVVECPVCDLVYNLRDQDRYRKIRCKGCEAIFEVGVRDVELIDHELFEGEMKKASTALDKISSTEKINRVSSFLNQHGIDSKVEFDVSASYPYMQNQKKYAYGNEIARGGMGVIYDTFDLDLKRNVVTKVLKDNNSKESIVKFIEEAQITGQLEHPNIVPVYDFGINGEGHVYFTMKKVRGMNVLDILENIRNKDKKFEQKYPMDVLLGIFIKICDGIAFAHQKRILHRDLKPDNIMVGEYGEVIILDWGLAKIIGRISVNDSVESLDEAVSTTRKEGLESHTLEGSIAGTPEYMSPEQAKGNVDRLGVCSDIYSLGCLLFTLVAKKLPVNGKTSKEVLSKVINGKIEKLPSATPPDLRAIIEKAMSYDSFDRYMEVSEMQKDLQLYLKGYSVSARDERIGEGFVKLVRRNKTLAIFVLIALCVFTFNFILILNESSANKKSIIEKQKTNDKLELVLKEQIKERKIAAPNMLERASENIKSNKLKLAYEFLNIVKLYDSGIPDIYLMKAAINLNDLELDQAYKELLEFKNKLNKYEKRKSQLKETIQFLDQLKNINNNELNIVDLNVIKNFMMKNNFDKIANNIAKKIDYLSETYERNIHSLSQEVIINITPQGVKAVFSNTDVTLDLSTLKEIPFLELSFDELVVKNLNSLKGQYLKRLSLSNATIESYDILKNFTGLEFLDVSDSMFNHVSVLSNLNLKELNVAGSKIVNLVGFEKLKLVSLDISGLPIEDLKPLQKMALKVIRLGNTKVKDLNVLKSMNLDWVSLWQTNISDLTPLSFQTIQYLDIEGSKVRSLDILKSTRISSLLIDSSILTIKNMNIINDLEIDYLCIRGINERSLSCLVRNVKSLKLSFKKLQNLQGLISDHTEELDLGECVKLVSLKGISNLQKIKKIHLPKGLKNYSELKKLPNLKTIICPEYGKQTAKVFFQLAKVH
ncbi:MAG: hypothetical protein COA79_23615 [Planctomycetota bacterium]|nr:MAG: hypothetical protein COA79_23615 [Planctomycetota bacterium]